MEIQISNKKYEVIEAKTEEELKIGLSKYTELKANEGMLFYLNDEKEQQTFNTIEMKFPIDIVFINQEQDVVWVSKNVEPGQKSVTNSIKYMSDNDYISYVLEVNANSGIKVGDSLDFEERTPVMKVLFPDGSEQMALYGGERIVSRRETRVLIKKAKKAQASQLEKDYKSLGKYIFKVFNKQDNREPEYVPLNNEKNN